MNMFRFCNYDNLIRDVLFAAMSFTCLLWSGPLLSHSAEENEKFKDTITCFNYLHDFASCDGLGEFTDTNKIDIESEDQNEREEFNHHFLTDDSNRMSLIRKQAFLIYPFASPMPGYLAPPPKRC